MSKALINGNIHFAANHKQINRRGLVLKKVDLPDGFLNMIGEEDINAFDLIYCGLTNECFIVEAIVPAETTKYIQYKLGESSEIILSNDIDAALQIYCIGKDIDMLTFLKRQSQHIPSMDRSGLRQYIKAKARLKKSIKMLVFAVILGHDYLLEEPLL